MGLFGDDANAGQDNPSKALVEEASIRATNQLGGAPTPGAYGSFSPEATQQRNNLYGYVDQLRNQQAPQLQRTQYNYAAPGQMMDQSQGWMQSAHASMGAATQDRTQQGQLLAGAMNDSTGQGQSSLVNRLQSDMNGGQPSLAQQQLQTGQAANARQALSMAAGARGGAGNQAAALRDAMRAGAEGDQTLNAQMGMQRAQEYTQARGELGNVLGQQRSQDLQNRFSTMDAMSNTRGQDIGQSNASFGQGLQAGQFALQQGQFGAQQNQFDANLQAQQNMSQANLEAGQRNLNLQGTIAYGAQANQVGQMDMNAKQSYLDMLNQRDLAERGIAFQNNRADRADTKDDINLVSSVGGGLVGGVLSDIRNKKDIKAEDVSPTLRAALDSAAQRQATDVGPKYDVRPAQGYSYEYKDPNAPGALPGRQYGPMAQDLEKTPAGASAVFTGPDGKKRVDTSRLSLVNTAALSEQQKKQDDQDDAIRQLYSLLDRSNARAGSDVAPRYAFYPGAY